MSAPNIACDIDSLSMLYNQRQELAKLGKSLAGHEGITAAFSRADEGIQDLQHQVLTP